jgi:RNA polymerase sigma factor (sigma-70 family)
MPVLYSESTRRFLQELDKLSRITHHESDSHLKTPKQLKGVRRLYEGDTSKFEPIPENREHLIKTLMPMVVSQAKHIAKKYGSRIEYDDCINSGLQGAIIATDKYIEKSQIEMQPAKLSTYAFSYICKYINEYCASVNTILSHGTTKWTEASNSYVMSGNQTYQDEGKQVEFFDIANDKNLMSTQSAAKEEQEFAEHLSKELFSKISELDKEILFMTFGVGAIDNRTYSVKEIATKLGCSWRYVQESVTRSIETIKTSNQKYNAKQLIDALSKSDLSSIGQWQRKLL